MLTFESVDESLLCDHSKDTSLLSNLYFLESFWKEIWKLCQVLTLATFGRESVKRWLWREVHVWPSRSIGTNKTVYNRDMSVQNNKMFDFKKPFCLAN